MDKLNELSEKIDETLKAYQNIILIEDLEDAEEYKSLKNDIIATIREHFEV